VVELTVEEGINGMGLSHTTLNIESTSFILEIEIL